MRVIFCILLNLSLVSSLEAQWYDPTKVGKKISSLYSQALTNAEGEKFTDALKQLDQCTLWDNKFVDGYLTKAGIFGEVKNYAKAVENYAIAITLDSIYCAEYRLPYSINLAGSGQFEAAYQQADAFLSTPGINESSKKAGTYRKKTYAFAIEQNKKRAHLNYVFNPINLGDSINTNMGEYFPTLTIDDQHLVFTRRVNGSNEDFYESWKSKDDKWSKALPLTGSINTDRNEGAQSISQDGKLLIFTSCNAPDGEGSCDLFYSVLTKRGWSQPFNLGQPINTEDWESQPSISPDKRALYFTARNAEGYGGSDLYVSYILPNGKWGRPMNMGPEINTSGDEASPFIHTDNQTLYFTSNGLPGYGGHDLFLVRKNSDGRWGKPENLGYPINTIDHEGTLFISSDGKTAFYASDRSDSRGALDLYTFELREDVRPIKTLWIRGKVYDFKTKIGLPSAVELKDLKTGQRSSKVQTDEEGNYLITLPIGKDYAFNVNRKGYLIYSENFNLSNNNADSIYQIDIPMQPIDVNANMILKNIFFDTGKFDLKKESTAELDNLVDLMNENATMSIQINGHTDNIGKATDNMTLSINRATSVISYLVSKGISSSRLQAKGFGQTQPIADNNTEENRAKNRRTELQVLTR
ncbi:MAG: OmpA family protein [Chitinophagaceae bacterium]